MYSYRLEYVNIDKENFGKSKACPHNSIMHDYHRAGGIGPAAPVLAGPVFSQGKSKIPFLQKASNKQSASVILGLIKLIILSYNR